MTPFRNNNAPSTSKHADKRACVWIWSSHYTNSLLILRPLKTKWVSLWQSKTSSILMYFSQYRRDNDSLKCHFTKEKQYQSASLLLGSETLRMEWHTLRITTQRTAIEESWIPVLILRCTIMSIHLKVTSPGLTFDMAVLYALQSHVHLACDMYCKYSQTSLICPLLIQLFANPAKNLLEQIFPYTVTFG